MYKRTDIITVISVLIVIHLVCYSLSTMVLAKSHMRKSNIGISIIAKATNIIFTSNTNPTNSNTQILNIPIKTIILFISFICLA